jgi:hypothetical protein
MMCGPQKQQWETYRKKKPQLESQNISTTCFGSNVELADATL